MQLVILVVSVTKSQLERRWISIYHFNNINWLL